MAPGEFRLRLCYGKCGRLRHLSHLELTHALERGARRAGLPYAVTKGFSPHMKVAFGPALPVGTSGAHEYLDVWLTRYLPVNDVLALLSGALPSDIAVLEARYVDAHEASLAAVCTVALYEVIVEGEGANEQSVRDALECTVAAGELRVEHKRKTKVFDLATSLPKEPHVRSVGSQTVVDITTRMGPQGSLRPDVLIRQALSVGGITGAIVQVNRLDTLIEDKDGGVRRPI